MYCDRRGVIPAIRGLVVGMNAVRLLSCSVADECGGMSISLDDIIRARRTIEGQVLRTPMLPAPKLSRLTGAAIFVKYENLQVTNSFKERGALNKLAALTEPERARGVIAMSAGNHAQAVAYHAASLCIPATIVMPVTTPFVKIEATKAHGAEVVLEGNRFPMRRRARKRLRRSAGLSGASL